MTTHPVSMRQALEYLRNEPYVEIIFTSVNRVAVSASRINAKWSPNKGPLTFQFGPYGNDIFAITLDGGKTKHESSIEFCKDGFLIETEKRIIQILYRTRPTT